MMQTYQDQTVPKRVAVRQKKKQHKLALYQTQSGRANQ